MASKGAEYMRSYRASAGGVSSLTAHDGHVYDLSGSPLVYGDSHAQMSDETRKAVDAFESKRYKNKVEFGQLIDADGNVVGEGRGGRGHTNIRATRRGSAEDAVVMTHNHPIIGKNGKHRLGGTFSETDIRSLNNPKLPKMQTIRATTGEGTYSLSKGRNFNYSGMMSHYKSVHDKAVSAHNERARALGESYHSGKITYSEYSRRYDKSFDRYLVDLHNGLRQGQKKYGYTYALERR